MVLSLFDICQISIRDSIEEGKLRDVSSLPPILRQSILDMILMQQTINNPNCLATLGSVDFLRGLTSFSLQKGQIHDDRYLKQVRKSMRSIDSDGTTIGSSIEELRLNFYGTQYSYEGPIEKTTFRNVIQLIKECVNLKILNLDLVQSQRDAAARETEIDDDDNPETEAGEESESLTLFHDSAFGGLLNNCIAMEPCLSVMENLDDLSLQGFYPNYRASFLIDHYPIIKFKNLRKLRVHHCAVDKVAWRRLLQSIQHTLISLDVETIVIESKCNDYQNNILPVPLPYLKSLTVITHDGFINKSMYLPHWESFAPIGKTFLENLADCKELEYVCLNLNAYDIEADLLALSRMNFFQLEVHINYNLTRASEVFDNESSFKLIDIFKEKVKKFELQVQDKNALFATALEHVVDVCSDLVKFHLLIDLEKGVLPREIERINSALVRLFSDEEHASKIRDLNLRFDVDSKVLTSVFRNCVNVKSLYIENCKRLFDDHLIDWALRGARPSVIDIYDCPNVSDAGLIPILVSSGGRLKEISIWAGYGEDNLMKVGEGTWRVLADHCRFVVRISGMPEMFDYLVEEKCFNKNVIER